MSADVNYIVDTPHDPKIAVLVASSPISGEVDTFKLRPVLLPVSLIISPDGPKHRWPWAPDNEIASFPRPYGAAITGNDVSFDSRKWFCGGTRFGGRCTRNRRDHDRTSFGLPPRIHNRTTAFANNLAVPHPRFRINRLTHCSQQTKT